MKNLLRCLGKTLRWVEEGFCCYKFWRHPEFLHRHPEFISGSQEGKQMLNPVQHDGNRKHPESHHSQSKFPRCHPEFISGSQESRKIPNPALHDGWRRTYLSLGRSMTEMLGVLAIIGVLSIGGLYAYRQAMMRYRLGQTQDWFSRMRLVVNERCMDDTTTCAIGEASTSGYTKRQTLLCAGAGSDFCINASFGRADFPYVSGVKWIMYLKTVSFFSVYFTGLDKTFCEAFIQYDWNNLNSIVDYVHNIKAVVSAKGQPLTQPQKDDLKARCPFDGYFQINFYP